MWLKILFIMIYFNIIFQLFLCLFLLLFLYTLHWWFNDDIISSNSHSHNSMLCFIYEVLTYEIPSTCAVCKNAAGGRTGEGKLCDSHRIVSSVLCATHYHGKTCNRHASPLCPFHTIPLQSVQWTCCRKLQ